MSWSFRITRVFGIDIKVHATFFLILGLGAISFGMPHGLPGAAFGVLLMTLLFACVVLHELGHALAARMFGVPTKEIILLPIGGVALLSRMPRNPAQELVIAVAGPLVNVAIAVLLLVPASEQMIASGLRPDIVLSGAAEPSLAKLVVWLLAANVSLVVFNMVPAFPLDGGRVLRATLAFFMEYGRATALAAGIGQMIAVALGLFGIFTGNILLALVAVFIFFGAGGEGYHQRTTSVLSRLRAGEAYNKHALALSPSDPVSRAVQFVLTSYQPDFAVLDRGDLEGIVTRQDLVRALAEGKADVAVAWVMRRDVLRVDAGMFLDQVRDHLLSARARVAAVFSGETYLGLVSLEDIAETLILLPHLGPRRGEGRRSGSTPSALH